MSAQEFHPRSQEPGTLPMKQTVAERDSSADGGNMAEAAATPQLLQSAGNTAISQVLNQKAMGSPLEPGFRRQMEHALGADFGRVRVRDDSAARSTAEAIDAKAFTHGDEIFLGQDSPSPDEPSGKRLLAHELTHVVQQRHAAALTPGINQPGDAFEQEAGRVSQQALQGQPATLSASGSPAGVQREDKKKPSDRTASRAEVAQALQDFLQRALAAQGGHGLRMTEAVKAAIRMLANAEDPNWKGPGGDPNRPLRLTSIEGLLTAGLGDPAELATRVANRLPEPFDRSALAHLKTMPIDDAAPSSKIERVKEVVEKSAPGEPEPHEDAQKISPEKKLEQDIATSRAMRGLPQPSGFGPASIDVLRAIRIVQGLPGALKPPKTPPSTQPATAKPVDIEPAIQKIPEDALVPAEARGTAQADSYAEAREVARYLGTQLDRAQQQGRESIELRLGPNYNQVHDRRAMITAVENLIQTVREALPHHATAVKYVDVYFGDRLVSRGVPRTSP